MLRLFIAVEIPSEIQKALYQLKEKISFKKAKWPSPENLHITLKFLGSCPEDKKEEIKEYLTKALSNLGSSSFKLGKLGCFPSEKKARVFWVGVEEKEPYLENLYKRIEAALEPLGFVKEKRPFHPHITLARLKTPENIGLKLLNLNEEKLPQKKIEVQNITLFKSQLTPQGAIYTPLAKIPLEKN